jgi:PTH1 family peptidyl-tRNA hydrolase
MKLIVGLGNPGKEYQKTRHNIGFVIIDELAKKLGVLSYQEKYKGLIAKANYKGEAVLLLKPQTYMNLSGESIRKVVEFYKLELDDVLVIFDDLDLPVGKLRLREKGSSGGHNGLKSIEQNLKTNAYRRIKFGIDKDPVIPTKDYVLGKFKKDNLELIGKQVIVARDAALEFVESDSFKDVMTKYNKR